MYCSQVSLVNSNIASPEATVLKCRSWLCDQCQPGRRKALYELALAGKPNKFLTLTVNPSVGIDPDDRARSLIWAWRILIKRLARRAKVAKIEHLWVVEATRKGEPHLHILMRADFIDKNYISEVMRELINAPIVDIQAVTKSQKMASYVSKYCSKDAQKFAGCKRYGYTANFVIDRDFVEDKENFASADWSRCNKSIGEIATDWTRRGYDVEWLSDESLMAHKTNISRSDIKDAYDFLPLKVGDIAENVWPKFSDLKIVQKDAAFGFYFFKSVSKRDFKREQRKGLCDLDKKIFVPPKGWTSKVKLRKRYKQPSQKKQGSTL